MHVISPYKYYATIDNLYSHKSQFDFSGIVGIVRLRHCRQGMITPAQCRAARGLLAWSQQELAQKAGVGIVTVHQLEAGTSEPRRATLEVIRRAFERAGVEFINENGGGPGLRLRKRQRKKA